MEPQASPSATQPSDQFVVLNQIRLHYRDWGGDRAGGTILLLHGGAANVHWWDKVAPALTQTGRVVALDFRGHGESQWASARQYGPQGYMADAQAFIEFVGGPVDLVGHSMGGAVALWVAAKSPELLRTVITVDARGRRQPPWRVLQYRWRRRAQGGQRPELAGPEAIIQRFRLSPPETHLSQAELAELALQCAEPLPNGKWAFRFDPETRAWRRRSMARGLPRLGTIRTPALLLRAADSTVLSRLHWRWMIWRIKGAQGREIPRAYHHAPLDNPAQTAGAIAEFIDSIRR